MQVFRISYLKGESESLRTFLRGDKIVFDVEGNKEDKEVFVDEDNIGNLTELIQGLVVYPLTKNDAKHYSGTIKIEPHLGEFEKLPKEVSLTSDQRYDLKVYLGYDKDREVNEWFETFKESLYLSR